MAPTVERAREILERIEEPEHYTGYTLCDPVNQRIGVVENVFVSEFGEPQYIRVRSRSGFFSHSSLLLPVERVAASTEHMTLILQ